MLATCATSNVSVAKPGAGAGHGAGVWGGGARRCMTVVWGQLVSRGWSLGDARISPLPHAMQSGAGVKDHARRKIRGRDAPKVSDASTVPILRDRMTEEERARKKQDDDEQRVRALQEHLEKLQVPPWHPDAPAPAPQPSCAPGAEDVTEEELGVWQSGILSAVFACALVFPVVRFPCKSVEVCVEVCNCTWRDACVHGVDAGD